MIRDLKPDFQINPDSDPDLCLIAPKMLWIRYLVRISHSTGCRENRAGDCMKNANKSPKIPYSAMVREVESDSEPVSGTVPFHHQKIIISFDCYLLG